MHENARQRPGWRRREVLRAGVAWAGSGLAWPTIGRGEDEATSQLLVRNTLPLDAETPVEAFDRFRTPNDRFFVRSHFGAPAVGLATWKLEVGGLVEKPRSLTLEDLADLDQVRLPAVLQCAGNGRGFYDPVIPGVGWMRGAVGNAEWSGVRLADVLRAAGLKPGAKHVHLLGADSPPNPKTPAFLRSIPLDRALADGTLVATHMNGEPLPLLHGGPLRLIVPTWTGNHWIKWLRWVAPAEAEAPGFYMQVGYRIPKEPAPPGAELKPEDLVPVTTMNVKSLIAAPSRGATLKAGKQVIQGVAWTGEGAVQTVEVQVDGGPWRPADIQTPARAGTWRLWRFDWDAPAGKHTVAARATDSKGRTQPEATPWNKSGYLWNGIDRVECEVA